MAENPQTAPATEPTPDDNWSRLGTLIEEASEKAARKVFGEWASKNNSSQTSGSPANPTTPPATDPPKKGFLEKLITG